eukprot:1130144-Alexandrium_andersonii.AAC.1
MALLTSAFLLAGSSATPDLQSARKTILPLVRWGCLPRLAASCDPGRDALSRRASSAGSDTKSLSMWTKTLWATVFDAIAWVGPVHCRH